MTSGLRCATADRVLDETELSMDLEGATWGVVALSCSGRPVGGRGACGAARDEECRAALFWSPLQFMRVENELAWNDVGCWGNSGTGGDDILKMWRSGYGGK